MKLNQKASISGVINGHQDLTANYEGGIAFKMDVKSRLYTRVASNLVGEPKFYHEINEADGSVDMNQDKLLLSDILAVAKEDPEFILQLAAYTRNVLNLRTISIILLVEASLLPECKKYIRKYAPQIIQRADELTEATAYLQKKIGHIGNKSAKGSMPSALKRGLADSFHKFDAFQLAKYNRPGFVKLKDVLKITHPKPKNAIESDTFKKLKEDSLPIPETWETVISNWKGHGFQTKKEAWEHVIEKIWVVV